MNRSALRRRLLALPRRTKQLLVLSSDLASSLFATWAVFSLRLERFHVPAGHEWIPYVLSPLLLVPVFIRLGLYRTVFRYSSIASFMQVGRACLLYGVLFMTLLLATRFPGVPRSLGITQPVFLFCMTFILRASVAQFLNLMGAPLTARRNVLILGAGDIGARAAALLQGSSLHQVCAFIDDNPAHHGQRIHGLVIYPSSEMDALINRFDITEVLVATPAGDVERRRNAINMLAGKHVRVRLASDPAMPGDDAAAIDIDVDDLLDRPPVRPGDAPSGVEGLVICVTGAGGSIGSELCRQVLRGRPAGLILIDHGEFALYQIQRELGALARAASPQTRITACLASVRDVRRMDSLFGRHKPDVVFHAAAYKHVPMVEANPLEAASNNVIGTVNVAQAAVRHGAARFTLVSTDKAVRPGSHMGASKRMAEEAIQVMAAASGKTLFSIVRFGNVLGSSGSVVPLFRRQIAEGGPVTITHPDVTRYFMTIPEAVALVIEASRMAAGGDVFILDMGGPVRIMDLARRMIRLSGHLERTADNPDGDIEIAVVGLRPGEKLHEELVIGDDVTATDHPRIRRAREAHRGPEALADDIARLEDAVRRQDEAALPGILRFTPAAGAALIE